ncbi:MAG TPA: ABC transporter permease [Anaerolineae bacterium]|nr:ABC transporter permease [Anaerolineae bacterium]
MLLKYTRAAIAAFKFNFLSLVTDSFFLFTTLLMPLIYAVIAFGILRDKGANYGIYIAIGSGMAGLWSTLLFGSGNAITSERWTGTLEMLAATPTPLWIIVFGKTLGVIAQSLLSMVASYILGSLLFGYPLTIAQPFAFGAALIVGILAFLAFGLILAPAFLLNPQIQQFQNAMEYPVYILCGFLFPIALLPFWTTPLSYVLSPYWTARTLQGAADGTLTLDQFALNSAMVLVLGVIYFFIATLLFRWVLFKTRVDATLGLQ